MRNMWHYVKSTICISRVTLGTSVHNPLRCTQRGSRVVKEVEPNIFYILYYTESKDPRDSARKREWPVGKAYEKKRIHMIGGPIKTRGSKSSPAYPRRDRERERKAVLRGKQKEREKRPRAYYAIIHLRGTFHGRASESNYT